jgi:glycosyltransferase involved in cell wall biosynthesis
MARDMHFPSPGSEISVVSVGLRRPHEQETLKILSLISSEGYYGMENMLVSLTSNLSRLGCYCVVGVFEDSRFPHLEVADEARRHNLAVELIPCTGRWDTKAVSRIRQLTTLHKVNILHPHGYKADIYAYAAARKQRCALVATSHNWPSKLLRMRAYAAVDQLVLGRFDMVAAVSDMVAATLQRCGVAKSKLSVIVNGVDVEHFANGIPTLRNELSNQEAPVVGFVGRLVPDKGGALLLQAAKKALAICPRAKFVFVGEGSSRGEWEALAAQLEIQESVVFTGVRKDMPGVYASFDIAVLPSLVESMPMCLLEAMAAGKPVIATKVGAIPRLVIPEDTGLLLKPGDVNELSEAIVRLLQDSTLAKRLGERARAHVSRHFSADAMAKSYMTVYDQVLANRRNRTQRQPELGLSY